MKTRIAGKEAARVAEDMAKPGPIRVVAAGEAQEAPGALVPSPGPELDCLKPSMRLSEKPPFTSAAKSTTSSCRGSMPRFGSVAIHLWRLSRPGRKR
jgi:hypothetical protein